MKAGDQNKKSTARKVTEIRKSKLSGQFFFYNWLPYPTRRRWLNAFDELQEQEKFTLIENIAQVRFICKDQEEYEQISQSCFFLEERILFRQTVQLFGKRKDEMTEQEKRKRSDYIQNLASKRTIALGVYTPFKEILQIRKNRKQAETILKKSSFSERFGQKMSRSMHNIKKLPQIICLKIKNAFTKEQPPKLQVQIAQSSQTIEWQQRISDEQYKS